MSSDCELAQTSRIWDSNFIERRNYRHAADGAKALRAAIHKVFGPQHPVQRCRNHKIRNVCERLPEEQKEQVKAAMRASYKLGAKEGMARLRKLAEWLEQEQPAAANSLREGLEECSPSTVWGFRRRCIAA